MDELLFELRAQRDLSMRLFEALDSKAGILLGFAGALAALAPGTGALSAAGRGVAIAAALLTLGSFVPRRFPTLGPRLGESLAESHPADRAWTLIALHGRSLARADRILTYKARALGAALVAMVLATGLLGASIMVSGGAR